VNVRLSLRRISANDFPISDFSISDFSISDNAIKGHFYPGQGQHTLSPSLVDHGMAMSHPDNAHQIQLIDAPHHRGRHYMTLRELIGLAQSPHNCPTAVVDRAVPQWVGPTKSTQSLLPRYQ
jgi:hypothetical protein